MALNAPVRSRTLMSPPSRVRSARQSDSWRGYHAVRLVALGAVLAAATACSDDEGPAGPAGSVETVEVVPSTLFLTVGGTVPLGFIARDGDGDPVEGLSPRWQTTDAAKVSVSPAGVITAQANGSSEISATLGSLKATSKVTILVGAPSATAWGVDRQGLTEVSLLGLWAASPTSVFVSGQDGVILRWTGDAWRAMATPTSETIVGIWGTSETNVFAVGSNGVILRYDGTAWKAMQSGTTATLLEVWGIDETHVYATGSGGTMLRFDGTSWSAMPNSAGPTEIWGIWGSSSTNLFAVGQNGSI